MAMTRPTCFLLFALAISAGAAADDYRPCSDNKLLVGACWDLRGRASLYNGNPSVRIWPIGTKRLLGVREAEPPLVPPGLAKSLSWDSAVFAELRVCPFTQEREGAMQIVCVAAVRNAVTRPR